jgi:hypothetical protein
VLEGQDVGIEEISHAMISEVGPEVEMNVAHERDLHSLRSDGREHVRNVWIQGMALGLEVELIERFGQLGVEARLLEPQHRHGTVQLCGAVLVALGLQDLGERTRCGDSGNRRIDHLRVDSPTEGRKCAPHPPRGFGVERHHTPPVE